MNASRDVKTKNSIITLTLLVGKKLMMGSIFFLCTALDVLLLELHPINIQRIVQTTNNKEIKNKNIFINNNYKNNCGKLYNIYGVGTEIKRLNQPSTEYIAHGHRLQYSHKNDVQNTLVKFIYFFYTTKYYNKYLL